MANLGQKTLFRKGVDVGIKALSSKIAKKTDRLGNKTCS